MLQIPAGLSDRATDGWEPLLTIADLAGGDWPQRARNAAVALHSDAATLEETDGVTLLTAIRDVFDEQQADRLTTTDLVQALVERDDGPWAEWWGRAVKEGDTRGPGHRLRKLLRPYEIASRNIRTAGGTRKGYYRSDFEDAFSRYPPPFSTEGEKRHNATAQAGHGNSSSRYGPWENDQYARTPDPPSAGDGVLPLRFHREENHQEETTRGPNAALDANCSVVAFPPLPSWERAPSGGPHQDDGRREELLRLGEAYGRPEVALGQGKCIAAGEEGWRAFAQTNSDVTVAGVLASLETDEPPRGRSDDEGRRC